jgi:hypothetical protein
MPLHRRFRRIFITPIRRRADIYYWPELPPPFSPCPRFAITPHYAIFAFTLTGYAITLSHDNTPLTYADATLRQKADSRQLFI